VSLTLGGCKGIEKVSVIVLLTATPVAVSTGSEEDISRLGALDANLCIFSNTILDILYYLMIYA
jgi:hypothetical protein